MDDICEPKIIAKEFIYESPEDHSIEITYNCNICYETECPYFEEYNS